MSPIVESLVDQLDGLRQRWWFFSLLATVTLGFAASLGVFFLLMLLDALCRFSQMGLIICAVFWLIITVFFGQLIVRRLLRDDRTLDGTARIVESEYPQLESRLINVVQLSRKIQESTDGRITVFEMAAVQRAASEVDRETLSRISGQFGRFTRFRRCMQTPRDWCESLILLIAVLGFAFVVAHHVPAWSSSANRLLQPWSFRPAVGLVGDIRVTPGDATVLVDTDLEVLGEIENPTGKVWSGTLYVTEKLDPSKPDTQNMANDESTGERAIPLIAQDGYTQFTATIPAISRPLQYRLEIGDSQSEAYRVNVDQPVTSGDIVVTYHYPAYLGRADESLEPRRIADLDAPQYTTATLAIGISRKITDCAVEFDNVTSGESGETTGTGRTQTRVAAKLDEAGTTATMDLPIVQNGTFRILFYEDDEQVNRDPRRNRITVRPDRPPTAELTTPATDPTAKPGEAIPVKFRLRDDHALGSARLLMRIKRSVAGDTGDTGNTSNIESTELAEDAGTVEDTANGTVSEESESETEVETWSNFVDSPTQREVETSLKVPSDLTVGDQVIFRVVVTDMRNVPAAQAGGAAIGPQEGSSVRRTVKIVSREERAEQVAADAENVRAAIWKILEKQIKTRTDTGLVGVTPEVRTLQVAIQRDTAQLAQAAPEGEKGERKSIRRRLAALAAGEMQQVVQECDRLVGGGAVGTTNLDIPPTTATGSENTPNTEGIGNIEGTELTNTGPPNTETTEGTDGRVAENIQNTEGTGSVGSTDGTTGTPNASSSAAALMASQDRIIEELRSILGVARSVVAKSEEALQRKRTGGDLPDDVRKKYEEAKKKLEEFKKSQRKVMEASQELAKKPVEDFTEEDEQKLKDLAATEDEWAKFLEDLHSDFSKLPEQDFANSSIAKELTEIQTEIKMAAGALTKKTADIAVPLEQLGYEMAENMTTNLERWLPDTPDRERWSQEESPSDADKEAPMAELPGELEDLVGELMEDEEDLFSEMEDASSSAIDSLDKGAGWDAADGPISNNSARGVTGNRLPNESEIAGRSGEGRQGKSSGEMVGDEAVGKGGRKTPTRLSNDAFQKGQIKDYSKDATGGATGGGKESGQGGTGLEGPAAPQRQRDLERLAGRQAELRNRAEAIQAQFTVQNRPTEDIGEMIDAMATVETELRAGNYQNALRQRRILVDKNTALQTDLSGGFEVTEDTTRNLPKEIRDQITTGTSEPSPAGWEELSRQYFESLSQ